MNKISINESSSFTERLIEFLIFTDQLWKRTMFQKMLSFALILPPFTPQMWHHIKVAILTDVLKCQWLYHCFFVVSY